MECYGNEPNEVEPLDGYVSDDACSKRSSQPVDTPVHLEISTGGRKKKVKVDFQWKEDMIYYIINQWQQNPLLYNVHHPQYYDKNKRTSALDNIILNMSLREFHPLPTTTQLLEKMNGLRTYFNTPVYIYIQRSCKIYKAYII